MKRLKIEHILLIVLFSSLGGCVNLQQPSTAIDYYTLEYDPPEIKDRPSLPAVVRIERFTVAPAYKSRQIIYRDRNFVRNGYVYRQWRATPADLVTYFLARDMRKAGLFEAVLPYDSRLSSTAVLEGSVDEFFEMDRDEAWEAVLAVGITLVAEKEPDASETILFQKNYRQTEPCAKKNPQALAEAMSMAMKRISAQIIEDIYYHVQKEK